MAKELIFQKILRYGRTVDFYKRRFGPGAMEMDGIGHQLLAGAAFSKDQHSFGIGFRADLDHLEDLDHGRRVAYQVIVCIFSLDFTVEVIHLLPEVLFLQGLFDCVFDIFKVKGFSHIIFSPVPKGLNSGIHICIGSDHNDYDVFVLGLEFLKQVQSAGVRQPDIQQDHVRGQRLKLLPGLLAGSSYIYEITGLGKGLFQRP